MTTQGKQRIEVPSLRPSVSSMSRSSSSSSSTRLSPVPTTVYVSIPTDRNYAPILQQTEIVYDQLLAERERKLQEQINARNTEYEDKYKQLLRTDKAKAGEFQRWASAALKQLKDQCSQELNDLRQDYESKFVKLKISLEEQWMAENHFSHHRQPSRPQSQANHHQ